MGIQACGKSTFCRLFFPDLPIVSMDLLKKRKREEKRVEALIASASSFIVDNTNPTAEDRQRYIPAAKAAGYRILGLFFPLDVQASLDRNAQREGKASVPRAALLGTVKKFKRPTREEGFDEIFSIRLNSDGYLVQIYGSSD